MSHTPATPELVRSALAHLSADCSYEEWRSIGMAIKDALGDAGYEVWDSWSRTAPDRYQAHTMRGQWASYHPGPITAGTLFGLARQAGWEDPRTASDAPSAHRLPAGPHRHRAPRPDTAAPPPPTPTRPYPPEEEVLDLLGRSIDPARDRAASAWCAGRHLDPHAICRLAEVGVLPADAVDHAPAWFPRTKIGDVWIRLRLMLPLYDADGVIRSVSCRAVDQPKSAQQSADHLKAARPTDYRASGLVMVNATARALLARSPRATDQALPDVIVVEGEPDFLTRCISCADSAVIGIYSGSWTTEIASRIPDGSRVYLETDRDKQGDAYAARIGATLARRCHLYRLREVDSYTPSPGDKGTRGPDINDLLCREQLLPPSRQCVPYTPPPEAMERYGVAASPDSPQPPAAPSHTTSPAPSPRPGTAPAQPLPILDSAARGRGADADAPRYPRTDLGNGMRLAYRWGADLRYCWDRACWYRWDGMAWRRDDGSYVERAAKDTVVSIYAEAAQPGVDDAEAAALAKWAMSCQSRRKLTDMISCARSDERMAITSSVLDADPWLLGTLSGVVDLRTGRLLPHDRDLYITHLCPSAYDPDADTTQWESYLRQICDGRDDLPDFLRRAVGYSLTGDTGEEVLFFVHGPGGSGKSTFIEAIKATLGDYATTADFETFVKRPTSNGPRDDVASLVGARFVSAAEVDEGKYLAEGLVKSITGGDTIRARFLYQASFEARPKFKLWLVANDPPRVRSTDDAIFRRIRVVPFTYKIPAEQRDPEVKKLLTDPSRIGPAILAWAVRGCLEWRRIGLRQPESVQIAGEQYRESMNPIAEFIDEKLIFGEGCISTVKEIRSSYALWCEDQGTADKYRVSPPRFNELLEARGCQRRTGRFKGAVEKVWIGLRLREAGEEVPGLLPVT